MLIFSALYILFIFLVRSFLISALFFIRAAFAFKSCCSHVLNCPPGTNEVFWMWIWILQIFLLSLLFASRKYEQLNWKVIRVGPQFQTNCIALRQITWLTDRQVAPRGEVTLKESISSIFSDPRREGCIKLHADAAQLLRGKNSAPPSPWGLCCSPRLSLQDCSALCLPPRLHTKLSAIRSGRLSWVDFRKRRMWCGTNFLSHFTWNPSCVFWY